MTTKQLVQMAEPGGRLFLLGLDEIVREGDYVEWMGGEWTRVDKGSSFIGRLIQPKPGVAGVTGYGFARIIPKKTREPSVVDGVTGASTEDDE